MTEKEAMKLRAAFNARIDALWAKHSVGELTVAQVHAAIDIIFDTMDEATEEAMFTDYAIRLVDFDDDPAVVCNSEAWYFSFNDQQWHPADRCAMTYKGYLCTPQLFRESPAAAAGRGVPRLRQDTAMKVVVILTLLLTNAWPVPKPDGAQCPAGFASESHYCVPMSRDTPVAIPKRGTCPSTMTASGGFCIETKGR